MMAALELTGPNMKTFEANTHNIAAAARGGGGAVKGWADTQKDFNFMIDQAKAWTGALAIQIGLHLIPYIEQGVQKGKQFVSYLQSHKDLSESLAGAIGGVLLFAIGAYTVSMIAAATATILATWPIIAAIAAIALLSAGVVYAYNHFGWFRSAVNALAGSLKEQVAFLQKDVPPVWKGFTQLVSDAWTGLKNFGSWISNTFGPILKAMGDALSKAGGFLNAINPFAKHSPSLVENVAAGVAVITGHYANMARSVQASMQSLNTSPGMGVNGAASLGLGAGSSGGVIAGGTGSRSETLLQQILDALTNPRAGTQINVSGAGLSMAALAQAIAQEQAFANKTAPAH